MGKEMSITNRTDLMNDLFRELNKYPRIKHDEEEKLLRIYHSDAPDAEREKAKEKILMGNTRYLVTMVKQYSKDGEDFNDLFDEAFIGLNEAIEMFDVTKGFIFLTFARHYVHRRINHYLNRIKPLVIPSNYLMLPKVKSEINRFYIDNQRLPTDEEIIDIMKEKYDISIKDVRDTYGVKVSSIGDFKDSDDSYTAEEDEEYTKRTASENLYDLQVENDSLSEALKSAMGVLSERDRKIIAMAYGLGGSEGMADEEIAQQLGYSSERIRQIRVAAQKKMRDVLTVKAK